MARNTKTKKAQVVTYLLTGNTVLQAAQLAGVTERTVYLWLNEPVFVEELRRQERQVLNACSWNLVSLSKQALDALKDVLERPSQAGASNKRLAAAQVLELVLKWRDAVDFETRLERLERQVFNGTKR